MSAHHSANPLDATMEAQPSAAVKKIKKSRERASAVSPNSHPPPTAAPAAASSLPLVAAADNHPPDTPPLQDPISVPVAEAKESKNVFEMAMGSIGDSIGSVGTTFKSMGKAISKTLSLKKKKKDGDAEDAAEGEDATKKVEEALPTAAAGGSPSPSPARVKKDKSAKTEASPSAEAKPEKSRKAAKVVVVDDADAAEEKKKKKRLDAEDTTPAAPPAAAAEPPAHRHRHRHQDAAEGADDFDDAPQQTKQVVKGRASSFGTKPLSQPTTNGGGGGGNFDEQESFEAPSAARERAGSTRNASFGSNPSIPQSNSGARVRAKYTTSMSLGDTLLHLYVVAVLRANEGEPPPRHLSVIAVADDEGRSTTATGGSSLLRSLNMRLGDVQGVETFTMSAADHSFAFPADSSTAQQTLADPKYERCLALFLTNVDTIRPADRRLVLSDPSGNYRCAVFEPKEGEQLSGSATAALQCRTKPIRVASAASPTSSLPTRSQIIQTKESSQTMEDARRQLEADHEREVDGMRSQLHRETESLSLHVRRLEEDILRKHKELSDVETAHGKREAQLVAEVEKVKNELFERTALVMKLKKQLEGQNSCIPAAAAAAPHVVGGGSNPLAGGDGHVPATSPPEQQPVGASASSSNAASDALLKVRQSIADGERFIESMRRRTNSPPQSSEPQMTAAAAVPLVPGRTPPMGYTSPPTGTSARRPVRTPVMSDGFY